MIKSTTILRGSYSEKNGVLYFISVPTDILPSRHKDPTDQKSWSPWRKENYQFFEKELSAFPDDAVVLDIGAGETQFRNILGRFQPYSLDFYPYEGVNIVCDLNRPFPFRDACADVLVLSNVLEHSAEPNMLLAECRRVLKPGGVVLGAVPFLIDVHQRPYDFYRYTDINLYYLLKKHGFSENRVMPVVHMTALVFFVTTRFFIQLIEKTKYSKNAFVQKFLVGLLRLFWKAIRISFKAMDPIFSRCAKDENLPLGYHFKGQKPAA